MPNARLALALSLIFCLGTACHEESLDGSSAAAFTASVMAMNSAHSVEEAQQFGADLRAAEALIGQQRVRDAMNGMAWSQARAYLDDVVHSRAR